MAEIVISLAAARVNAGLTQQEAASHIHVTKRTIMSWEKGETIPRIDQAAALSKLYDIPVNNLFFGIESRSKRDFK